MTGDNAQSIGSWTECWRTGTGASRFEGPDVEVRLTQVWNHYVDAPPDGARILDLATGNGTAARSCAARARAREIRLQIEAVDAVEQIRDDRLGVQIAWMMDASKLPRAAAVR